MLTLKKYLTISALSLVIVGQMTMAATPFGFITGLFSARKTQRELTAEELKALQDIKERAQKIQPIKEFTAEDIAVLDRLMDNSPARNILWGTFVEERGESTVGLRNVNKQILRLFLNRDAEFDCRIWSSDVHRPIGYSMPAISNPADNENAPTELERRLKGQVCAKFFKAVYNAKYYPVDKHIKAAELLAERPNEGEQIYEEVFGIKYKAE
jgi:hypothetical protein